MLQEIFICAICGVHGLKPREQLLIGARGCNFIFVAMAPLRLDMSVLAASFVLCLEYC